MCKKCEILKYDNFIKESNENKIPLYSDKFVETFKKVSNFLNEELKKKFLSILQLENLGDYSYIDYNDNDDSITFYSIKRMTNTKFPEEPNINRWKDKRNSIGIGRFFSSLNKQIIFDNKEIEQIVNAFKSIKDSNKDPIFLVEGELINWCYNEKNYDEFIGGSPLHNSCMRKVEYFDIYINNPDKVKLLVLTNGGNPGEEGVKVRGRSLVWFTDQETILEDRIYYITSDDEFKLRNYGYEKGWFVKRYNRAGAYEFINKEGKTIWSTSYTISLNKYKLNHYPYLDTFCYMDSDGVLSSSHQKYRMLCTNGTIDEVCLYCDGDGTISCSNCDGSGNETCNTCDGDGKISCSNCDGSGNETCNTCDGDGKITKEKEIELGENDSIDDLHLIKGYIEFINKTYPFRIITDSLWPVELPNESSDFENIDNIYNYIKNNNDNFKELETELSLSEIFGIKILPNPNFNIGYHRGRVYNILQERIRYSRLSNLFNDFLKTMVRYGVLEQNTIDDLKMFNTKLKIKIKEYYSLEEEEVDCEDCGGSGEIECSDCDGDGEVNCSDCDGDGAIECSYCKGSGTETCENCEDGWVEINGLL